VKTVVLLTALALAGATQAAGLPGPAFPSFSSAAELKAACDHGLAGARQRVKALERRSPSDAWLAAFDGVNAYSEDAYGAIALLPNVHPDKAIREAAQACEMRWQDFASSLGQNEVLYRAARQVKPRDGIDAESLRLALENFEDSGVALPPEKRQRAKQLQDHVTELGLQFNKNVREDGTQVPFTPEDLKGVPEGVWSKARRDDAGHVMLGLDYPTYFPVMESAESPTARERMWRAKTNEGGEANLKLLDQIARERRELAGLFGFASYDDFVLRRRMVGSTARATAFLDDVKAAVTQAEQRELGELRAAKARDLKQSPEATKLDRWDVMYYTERVRRERYSVDQEAFRQYFPPQESLQFVMRVAEKMLGVRYTRVPAKLWYPEAQAYAVSEVATGKPLATLYVDLYPRPNKYNHAAVWSFRNASTLLNRTPQAALVVNLDRKGLRLDELETLLHEFGHSVHNNLSTTRYSAQGGTNVLNDFAEAPSQMLEDWVYDKHVLKVFAEVCPTCKPVPDELIDKAVAARDYGKGVRFARQHLYASYDLALYDAQPVEALPLWMRMEGGTPLGYVSGTRFPAGFSHVATNYAAGYYGYLWSLVVAMDMRTAFGDNKLDPVVGARYRRTVLANGGQREPLELVRDFLGRDTNSKAFFDYLKK
jgi:thimet oligopeptidase